MTTAIPDGSTFIIACNAFREFSSFPTALTTIVCIAKPCVTKKGYRITSITPPAHELPTTGTDRIVFIVVFLTEHGALFLVSRVIRGFDIYLLTGTIDAGKAISAVDICVTRSVIRVGTANTIDTEIAISAGLNRGAVRLLANTVLTGIPGRTGR